VARAGWHDNGVAAIDLVCRAVDHDVALAPFDAKELIVGCVGLLTDVLAGFQRHQDE